MSRTVYCPEEVIVVSKGKEDIGKLVELANDGKFDPSVIPEIDSLQEQVKEEVTERAEADKQLQTNIDFEVVVRTTSDQDLQSQISAEIAARINADKTESSNRVSTDQNLQEQVDVLNKKNAFSNVLIDGTTIQSDSREDNIELEAGTNIALTADTESKKVTIAVTGKVASAEQAESTTKLETARKINGVDFDGTEDITIAVSTMPIGTIIMWAFPTLPAGDDEGKWLECNGQSTDGHPELAAIAGSNVPDYRGYFLRGLGGNSAKLGVEQGDAIRNITASSSFCSDDNGSPGVGPFSPRGAFYGSGATNARIGDVNGRRAGYNNLQFDASKVVPTAEENRPVNKAVIYLIRAK